MSDPLAGAKPDMTPYRYSFNDPINITDPSGLIEERETKPVEYAKGAYGELIDASWVDGDGDRYNSQGERLFSVTTTRTDGTSSTATRTESQAREVASSAANANNMNQWLEGFQKKNEEIFGGGEAQQGLPTYKDMNSNYPKDPITGGDMYGPDVYKLVGGNVEGMYNSDPSSYANACALRVSYALNKSGVKIPAVKGTYKGADGNNYFLGASTLNDWMTSYFGEPDVSARSSFENQIQGKQGIYIMTPNYPGKFGASGHATLFDGSSCIGNHCYFNATGGVYQVNLWILK